jgi:hypothetical protein
MIIRTLLLELFFIAFIVLAVYAIRILDETDI